MLYHNHGQVPVYIGGKLIHPNDSRDVDPASISITPPQTLPAPPGDTDTPPPPPPQLSKAKK